MKLKLHLLTLFILCSKLCVAQVIYIDNASKDVSYDASLFETHEKPTGTFKALPVANVKLLPSLFSERYSLNKKYLLSLDNDKLLQNWPMLE